MVTTLAILFVIFLIGTIFYGFGIVMRRPPTSEELRTEKCSLCGNRFPKDELVERQIGDYRLFHFCPNCIVSLNEELQGKGVSLSIDSRKLISEIEGKRN